MRKWCGVSSRVAGPVLVLFLLMPAALAFGFTKEECAKAGITHPKKLVTFVAGLQRAVRQGDKVTVAGMMRYPFWAPLGDAADIEIKSPDVFLKQYDAIMTKAMQESLLRLQADDIIFNRAGALLGGDNARQLWALESANTIQAYFKGI